MNLALVARWSVILAAVALTGACSRDVDTVFYPLSVEFAAQTSESDEGDETVDIALHLSAPSTETVTVEILISDGLASGHDTCASRDYSFSGDEVVFPPGAVEATLSLRLLNDNLPEADETVLFEIRQVSGAVPGARVEHVHFIVDDDRDLLVDIQLDFGALGNGQAEDTEAIQRAIERARGMERAVVYFPPGDYVVSSLDLAPGTTYVGDGARLLLAPRQPENAQMLVLSYSGASDSSPTFFQGLTFDGTRQSQGEFDDWQLQDSALLVATGDPSQEGRAVVVGQDLAFEDAAGSGMVLRTNTDTSLCRIVGREVFTDLVKLAGGASRLSIQDLQGEAEVGTTGIALLGSPPGFGNSAAVEVDLDDLELKTGDLEIDVHEGAVVAANDVRMSAPPLFIRAVRSQVRITNSQLHLGPPRYRANRIVAPNDVVISDSEIVVREMSEPYVDEMEAARTIVAANVTWDDVTYAFDETVEDMFVEELFGQSLTFRDCRFVSGDDIEASDTLYAAGSVDAPADSSQSLVFQRVEVDAGFSDVFDPACNVCQMLP